MSFRIARMLPVALVAVVVSAGPEALASDGQLDPTFSSDGRQTVGFVQPPDNDDRALAVVAQPNGALLLAGEACGGNDCVAAVTRLLANGPLDPSFDGDGRLEFTFAADGGDSSARELLLLGSGAGGIGGIVVVGRHFVDDQGQVGLARLTAGGDFDLAFGSILTPGRTAIALPSGDVSSVTSAAFTSTGEILVGGYGRQTGQTDRDGFVARFTSLGELDGGFSGDGVAWIALDLGGNNDSDIRAMAVQPDGKIVTVGAVDRAGGDADVDTAIVRLLPGGTLDPAFDGAASGNGVVIFEFTDLLGVALDQPYSLVLQPDGRILFGGGTFILDDLEYQGYFGRLLADGSTDPTLAAELPPIENRPTMLELQSDGKILFASLGSNECTARRYFSGGDDLDPSFGGDGIVTITGAAGLPVECFAATLAGGRLVLVGVAEAGDFDFFAARLQSELIFRDGFESDSTAGWGE
jgi:uncharacterized delta-60 repeat protein